MSQTINLYTDSDKFKRDFLMYCFSFKMVTTTLKRYTRITHFSAKQNDVLHKQDDDDDTNFAVMQN